MPQQTGFARAGTAPQVAQTPADGQAENTEGARNRPTNERNGGVAAGFGAATGEVAPVVDAIDLGLTPDEAAALTDRVLATLESHARTRIEETPDFVATFVTATSTASITRDILRERLQGQVTDEELLNHMLEDANIFQSLHERYETEVRTELANRSMGQLDAIVESYAANAAADVTLSTIEGNDARINYCMGRRDKFMQWLQRMFKRILHAVASWDAPSKIFLNVRSIDLPEEGASAVMLWDNRSANMLHRGQYGVVDHFPWLGRLPMYVPDGADDEAKALVKRQRRVFAKALMLRLYEVARSQTRT